MAIKKDRSSLKSPEMVSIQIHDTSNGKITTHQFGLVFSHATIGIVVTNNEGTIINFNGYAEKQFGYTQEEILGKKMDVLIPRGYQSLHTVVNSDYQSYPLPHQIKTDKEIVAVKKDGTQFPVEVSLSPYSLGGETFVITFIVDITIRKNDEERVLKQKEELERITSEMNILNSQLEQKVDARTRMLREALSELERSKEELSEALENEKHINELKSKFVTLASHEFRTPLSTILSSAFLLEKYNGQPATEQRLKHIQRIRSSVLGLKSILDDFLSVGKLEEGKVKNVEQEINSSEIHKMVQGVTEDLEQLLKPGQRIIFECKVHVKIKADIEILKNIIINLISNAIKFSGDNSLINIICSADKKELAIAVKDQGIGISQKDMKHLTERFFRAENAANIQGTGLGLHIIEKYLELIQGRMEIQSVLNEGSCFTIYLPLI